LAGVVLAGGTTMPRPPSPLTLILGAMPSEIRLIRTQLKGRRQGAVACFPYDAGLLRGRRVVLAATGVGVTNGAMVAALFLREFAPDELIVTGTGSRVNPRIRTGDTVISTRTIHHGAGSLTNRGMVYRKVRGPLPGQMTGWYFRPDPRLLRMARAAIPSYAAEPVVVARISSTPAVLTGVVTASDLFGVSEAKIADLRAKLDPDIMEMESAAIAQVCVQLGVPHIVFRAGSNLTQSNPGAAYRRLGQTAAAAAARWTVHFVGYLAAQAAART
jgi:adenosylhomocysteine nucleosidase